MNTTLRMIVSLTTINLRPSRCVVSLVDSSMGKAGYSPATFLVPDHTTTLMLSNKPEGVLAQENHTPRVLFRVCAIRARPNHTNPAHVRAAPAIVTTCADGPAPVLAANTKSPASNTTDAKRGKMPVRNVVMQNRLSPTKKPSPANVVSMPATPPASTMSTSTPAAPAISTSTTPETSAVLSTLSTIPIVPSSPLRRVCAA